MDAKIHNPIIVADMQDMGNEGNIAIDFISKSLITRPFRLISVPYPNYVVDSGGHIEFRREKWEHRFGVDGLIFVFGGGLGQPQTNQELYDLGEDIIQVARQYSVQLVYTLGAFHAERQ